ncbi:MAG: nucleotidyltransferase family protein [Alphaproteobacteria bacterium]|nr:nucleotidyltransferase family protein [Alphaproteobacteria bacterium]
MTPTVVVLAAGSGSRFRSSGGDTGKLQALLNGHAVLDHVLKAVRASGLPWQVVNPADTAHHTEQGMGTSIATGVTATPDAHGWLILPGDLPLIQTNTLLAVTQALRDHAVVVPTYHGENGHPVGFAASCGPDLMALRGDQGARSVVRRHGPPHALPCKDIGCVHDVDTTDRLRQAEDWLRQGRPDAGIDF